MVKDIVEAYQNKKRHHEVSLSLFYREMKYAYLKQNLPVWLKYNIILSCCWLGEVHEDNNSVWSNEGCLRVLCTKHLSLKLSESRMFRLCRFLYYSHLHDITLISSHPSSLCDLLYNRTLLYDFIFRKKQKTAKKVPKYSFFV